jgi:YD repeat-containing protein
MVNRILTALLSRLLALIVAGGAGLAHDVSPISILLRPAAEDYVYVFDPTGCKATITARSTAPGLVKVYAVHMGTGNVIQGTTNGASATVPGRVDQVFLVRAEPGISVVASAAIEVCWVGEGGLCNENNCSPYAPKIVAVQVDPDPLSIGHAIHSGIVGDPISSDDGEVFLAEEADLDLGGPMGLAFRRTYSSRWLADGVSAGALGANWRHGFDWSLASTGHNVEITTPTGRVIRFQRTFFDPAWKLALYDDIPFQLADSGADKRLGDPTSGLIRTFDANGRLTRIEDGHGNVHTLSYVLAGSPRRATGSGAR